MIKEYQKRFVKTMMLSLTLIVVLMLTLINTLNIYQMYQQMNEKIDFIIANDGKMPRPNDFKKDPIDHGFFETRYFIANLLNEQIITIDTSHIYSITSIKAEEYAQEAIYKNKTKGFIDDYYFRLSENNGKRMIVFINIQNQSDAIRSFFLSSLLIGIISLIALFIIIYFASKRAIIPMMKGIEQQKRFITDAGHEIKTPLAIISANNEVLEMTIGENEWIKSSQNQIARLNDLVKKMLMLSKMEETHELELVDINVSECLESTLIEFKPLFDQKNITLQKSIQNDIILKGDAASIQTLTNILLENAVKYITSPYILSIKCYQYNKKRILEVYNSCEKMDLDPNMLFERFYRSDESRSSTISGQGIGLSIAKAIVDVYHGKISAQMVDEGILFKVEL